VQLLLHLPSLSCGRRDRRAEAAPAASQREDGLCAPEVLLLRSDELLRGGAVGAFDERQVGREPAVDLPSSSRTFASASSPSARLPAAAAAIATLACRPRRALLASAPPRITLACRLR
jgi:hypothetical protein